MEVHFVTPEGEDTAGIPVTINYKNKIDGHEFGWTQVNLTTDKNGRISFDVFEDDGKSGQNQGHYLFDVHPEKDWTHQYLTLKPKGLVTTVSLKKGAGFSGTLIDRKTGCPIPYAEVFASPIKRPASSYRVPQADELTDSQGRFHFSNLTKGEHEISYTDFDYSGNYKEIIVDTNNPPKNLIIKADLKADTSLKPNFSQKESN